jgi:DtxR family manganese transport transcriptional regulator
MGREDARMRTPARRGGGAGQEAGASTRFERVRQDHAREAAEDYAELILDLGEAGRTVRPSELAHRLGVTHVTVLRALDRLLRDGLITRDADRGILLSPDGLRMGESSRERHRVVQSFLERLGVPREVAAIDAEGIEHHVSKIALRKMEAFLREPVPGPERRPARRRTQRSRAITK